MKKLNLILAVLLVVSVSLVISSQGQAQINYPYPVEIPSSAEELALAPLLDLHNGGIAAGAAQGSGPTAGVLIDGSLLPAAGEGFTRGRNERDAWGAGIMISMIMNSASVFSHTYPGTSLRIGGIAQQNGGAYGPHKSHQNGLDADILFVGQQQYDSVLDADGKVTARFDIEKNWAYWRLITSQRVINAGKSISAVSMILVDPRIKEFLCAGAKDRGFPQDALDIEVMQRLRPTEGHDDHFHVRMRCSPAYPDCLSARDAFKGLGCD